MSGRVSSARRGKAGRQNIKLSGKEQATFDDVKSAPIPETKSRDDLRRLIRQYGGDKDKVIYQIQSWWEERERKPKADEWAEVGGAKHRRKNSRSKKHAAGSSNSRRNRRGTGNSANERSRRGGRGGRGGENGGGSKRTPAPRGGGEEMKESTKSEARTQRNATSSRTSKPFVSATVTENVWSLRRNIKNGAKSQVSKKQTSKSAGASKKVEESSSVVEAPRVVIAESLSTKTIQKAKRKENASSTDSKNAADTVDASRKPNGSNVASSASCWGSKSLIKALRGNTKSAARSKPQANPRAGETKRSADISGGSKKSGRRARGAKGGKSARNSKKRTPPPPTTTTKQHGPISASNGVATKLPGKSAKSVSSTANKDKDNVDGGNKKKVAASSTRVVSNTSFSVVNDAVVADAKPSETDAIAPGSPDHISFGKWAKTSTSSTSGGFGFGGFGAFRLQPTAASRNAHVETKSMKKNWGSQMTTTTPPVSVAAKMTTSSAPIATTSNDKSATAVVTKKVDAGSAVAVTAASSESKSRSHFAKRLPPGFGPSRDAGATGLRAEDIERDMISMASSASSSSTTATTAKSIDASAAAAAMSSAAAAVASAAAQQTSRKPESRNAPYAHHTYANRPMPSNGNGEGESKGEAGVVASTTTTTPADPQHMYPAGVAHPAMYMYHHPQYAYAPHHQGMMYHQGYAPHPHSHYYMQRGNYGRNVPANYGTQPLASADASPSGHAGYPPNPAYADSRFPTPFRMMPSAHPATTRPVGNDGKTGPVRNGVKTTGGSVSAPPPPLTTSGNKAAAADSDGGKRPNADAPVPTMPHAPMYGMPPGAHPGNQQYWPPQYSNTHMQFYGNAGYAAPAPPATSDTAPGNRGPWRDNRRRR